MPFADVGDVSLYYEFTGPEDKPLKPPRATMFAVIR